MADAYKKPELSYHYCAQICPIGARYGNDVEPKALSQIVLEVLSFLDDIAKERERLVEISVDGRIADDELRDFARIKSQLDDIAQTVDALQLWLEKTIAADGIDAEALQLWLEKTIAADGIDAEALQEYLKDE